MGKSDGIILGSYEVALEDVWSYHFDCPILSIPYMEMAQQELRDKPEMIDSKYYQYLKERQEGGLVFRRLTPEERFKEWRELSEITEYTVSLHWERYNGKWLLYGGITAYYDGKNIKLVDGHHRVSFMKARGLGQYNITLFNS